MTAIRLDEATVRALAKAIADELEQRPVLLTRQQAAKALGVSVQFFDAHVRRRVPPLKLTGAPRWSRSALFAALDGLELAAPTKALPARVRAAGGAPCLSGPKTPRGAAILSRLQKRKAKSRA